MVFGIRQRHQRIGVLIDKLLDLFLVVLAKSIRLMGLLSSKAGVRSPSVVVVLCAKLGGLRGLATEERHSFRNFILFIKGVGKNLLEGFIYVSNVKFQVDF